ncbi:ARPP-2 domain-containing protein, partial [Nocardiopsis lucentensis]|uniref:ARPP-2 domain-containing protein n=1 Tax=Nocardiopsis lucentensis TaxID=53441 RepID=UPI00035F482E
PLHLAMDGLLSLGFGGPPIAWAEWARSTVREGLSPRAETAYLGGHVGDLQEALRVFEIHPDQCGVVIHVADTLATVHVVPHPDDYRALHPTLLLDMFGEQLYVNGLLNITVRALHEPVDPRSVRDLADLRRAVRASRAASAKGHDELMLPSLTGADHTFERLYTRSGFTLSRFLPSFRGDRDNHIGEVITAADGRVAYLKTFRLSNAQVRRGRLLKALGENDWSLADTARALGTDRAALVTRLERAGLAHLLNRALLKRHRAERDRRVGRHTP